MYLSAKSESDEELVSSSRKLEECFPIVAFEDTGR
jgi:hypothetical protein